jgi:pseudaminic acid cytidylyltransferase
MKIAIIPARGGSTRIPHKNIEIFCGEPIIAYAISAAKKLAIFDHIIVSTDDAQTASIARQLGASTPFVRPAELADDNTSTVAAISHAVAECLTLGWDIDFVCCIYPSVPLIDLDDISLALNLLQNHPTAAYSFPVTEFPSKIQRAFRIRPDGLTIPFYPEFELDKTQDLDPAYHDAGQFYWGKPKAWLNTTKIHSNGVGLVIPNWRVADIDTVEDWKRAELLYKLFQMEIKDEL